MEPENDFHVTAAEAAKRRRDGRARLSYDESNMTSGGVATSPKKKTKSKKRKYRQRGTTDSSDEDDTAENKSRKPPKKKSRKSKKTTKHIPQYSREDTIEATIEETIENAGYNDTQLTDIRQLIENSGRNRPRARRSPYYQGEPFIRDEAANYKPFVFEMNEDGVVEVIVSHAGISTVKITDKIGKDEDEPLTPISAQFPPDLPAYPRSPAISAHEFSYMEPGTETAQTIKQYG